MAIEQIDREVRIERHGPRFEGMRVSWGGIWAGVLVVLGTLLFLSTLGLAVGISADSRRVDSASLGTGAVIWSAVSLLVALFLGGLASTRMSMVWERSVGLLQGVLVWVTSLVAVGFLGVRGVELMGGGALGIVTGAAASLRPDSAFAWVQFIAVALSLVASLAGSALGRRRAARRATTEPLEPPGG